MIKRLAIAALLFCVGTTGARADWFSETWPSVRGRIEELTPQDYRHDARVPDCVPSDIPLSPSIDLSPDVSFRLLYPDERYLRACDPPEAPRYSIYYREGEIIVYSLYESQRSAVSGQQLDEIGQLTADGKPLTADGQQSAASGQQSAEENRLTVDSRPLTVLKEWIYTEEPNMPEGSRYSWNISGAQDVLQDDAGRVHVIAGKASYTIDPVVYWTQDDAQHAANWQVTTPTPGVEVVIRAKADDYPLLIDPTVNYGQWLGGASIGLSVLFTAMTIDPATGEIYIAGVLNSGGGTFDGFAFNGEAHEGLDLVIAEIADGGTPTLVWGQYLGGNSSLEQIYVLAAADDEIFAGGYSQESTFWDEVTFSGSHSGSDEGFVVKIADGGTPSLVWGQWFGGVGSDYVLGLAFTGDEIYASGYSVQSTSFESVTFQGAHNGGSEGFVVEILDGGTPSLVWGQWLGGTGNDMARALAISADEIYAGGYSTVSTSWEAVTFQGVHDGQEAYVVEIADGGTPSLVWGQWLGGVGTEYLYTLVITADEIYAGGYSTQSTSWESVGFAGTHDGASEGFVVEIGDGGTPTLAWGQWLGGVGNEYVYALGVTGDEIYAAGQTSQSTAWESVTFGGEHSGDTEVFVVEIADGGTPSLVWGQWLGGISTDNFRAVALDGDEIYAGGYTQVSTNFESVSFVGEHSGSIETFIIEIADGGTPSLTWGMWIGTAPLASGIDVVRALVVNGSEIYAGGYSAVSTAWESVTFQGAHSGGSEGFVVEIGDGGAPTLVWGQWLGGSSMDVVTSLAVTGDEIYAGGYSDQSTSFEVVTFAGTHDGSSEGFVAEIADGGTPSLVWAQWLGGTSHDYVISLGVTGDEIYAGGYSTISTSWESVTFQGVHNGGSEGFVVEILDGGTPSLVWGQWLGGSDSDIVYALAVTGDEIYAGGKSWQSTSFEAVTFQGAHSGGDEGFVIEIGDAGTPTLVWGQWLGGDDNDYIYALAVTGDEIYAGGLSWRSTLYEAVTFQGAHSGNMEGYVVEIGDGGTPTLVWGQWLGGSGGEAVYKLAVTEDEIYAGGYSDQSTSFEAVTFGGAHSGGSEGFIVEIGDGGTPTLVWGQWMGGAMEDMVRALAVAGDEIYVGGYSYKSTSWEAVTFQGAHSANYEGFVIEMSDDGAGGGGGAQDVMFFGPMF